MWCTNSQLAVDHVLAGSFESAMRVSSIIMFFSLKIFSHTMDCYTSKNKGNFMLCVIIQLIAASPQCCQFDHNWLVQVP